MRSLLFLAALLPASASAATGVLYDPAVGQQAVATAWVDQHGHDGDVRYISVDDVFDPAQPAILLGDARALPCAGEAADRAAFQALSQHADDSAFGMDYLGAATSLERLTRLLPCLTEVPDSAELSHFHLLRGVVAYYAQGQTEATKRFEEALLVTPFLQWDRRYPPDIRPSFEEAVRGALHAEKAFFSVSPRIVDEGTFYVNGLTFDPRTRTANLYAGSHLLQWVPTDGPTATWVVQVDGGQFVTLVQRQDAVDALLTGRADAGVTEFALQRVLAPVEREAVATVAVAEDWDVMLFHEYDVLSGRWQLADLDAIEIWRQSGRGLRGAGVGLIAGGVLAGVLGGVIGGRGAYDADGVVKDAAEHWEPVEGQSHQQADFGDLAQGVSRFSTAQTEIRLGMALGVVGGALTVAGVPLTILGDRRARAAGLSKAQSRSRKAPRPARP